MRSSSSIVRSLFLSFHIPATLHFQDKLCTSSRSMLLTTRSRHSLSAAFEVIESNPLCDPSFTCAKNVPSQFSVGFKKIPRIIRSRECPNLVSENAIDLRIRTISSENKDKLKLYSGLLNECASKGSLNEGKTIHGQIIKNGIVPDSYLWVSLINVYAKCRFSMYGRRVLCGMPERDVVSWSALIQGFVAEGCPNDGAFMLLEMKKEGIRPNEFTLVTGLKACSMCLALYFGKQLHAETIKLGFLVDLFVGSALVDFYAKCGEVQLASLVFFGMPEQNIVSWNALLNGYAQEGNGKEVLSLFCRMTESDMKFSKFTLSTVLKGCANSRKLREGQIVHSVVIKKGCDLDEFIGCSMVDMYSKCGFADDALKVFLSIKEPDVVAWSAMITCLDQQGQRQKAAELFNLMRRTSIRPNRFSLCALISLATDIEDLQYGQSIHACMYKYGFETDISASNALVTMYMRNGCVRQGAQVFEAMTDRDLISWNAHLSGLHDHETCDLGPNIFYQMLAEGLRPNMYTFISVLRSCSSLSDVSCGRQIHAHIVKDSLQTNGHVQTALIDMYVKSKCLEDADVAFNRLIRRDLFTWTIIITGHARRGQAEKAVNYFRQMHREGVKPNEFTLAGCLSGCSRMASLESGQQLHSLAIKGGHLNDMFVTSALIDMYAKCGCIEDAESLFKGLDLHDTVLWNTMICSYSQHGLGKMALDTFRMMVEEGITPDEVTFLGVLSACSHQGLVEEGKRHFASMDTDFRIKPKVEHFACMVDILGRTGEFEEVGKFIENMNLTPHELIWETILGACKMHGNAELGERAAEKLFELQPKQETNYILLSNIYAAKGKWDGVEKVRTLMSNRGVKKEPGCSWVEMNSQVHIFVSQDGSHPKFQEIYSMLEEMSKKLSSAGYTPKTEYVLHNVTEREKREHLQFHSERLALAFSLLSSSSMKTIRIFKNLRICGDCHDVMKIMSNITSREIVVRDINRFHHFKSGSCSCQDYW